ncbi:MAG TPA: hypothetical protein VMH28_18475 [Candidatus Acidoferrales bacterium]|nr:hypothetical protein [Candidatus Acidoferrales bacterium]
MYYQKIRDMAGKILDEYPVVVSKGTADGGQAGIKTEVPRQIAAKLIIEGSADLVNEEEAAKFRAALAEAKRAAEQAAAATRLQVSVISTADLESLKATVRGLKEME